MMFIEGSSKDARFLDFALVEVIDRATLELYDHPEIKAGGRVYPRIRPVNDLFLITPYDDLNKIPPCMVEDKKIVIDLGRWDEEESILQAIKKTLIYVANCKPEAVKATASILSADNEENIFYEYDNKTELYAVHRYRNIRPVRRGRTLRC